jgi:hypothetical protein
MTVQTNVLKTIAILKIKYSTKTNVLELNANKMNKTYQYSVVLIRLTSKTEVKFGPH